MIPSRNIETLIEIMVALRHPIDGCPWDKEQTFRTIAPYTVEEAHEVADAIARQDLPDLCDELGDLLLQVVYHARLAEEIEAFKFDDVVLAITEKMIRRHPHVFGDEETRKAGAAKGFWEKIKAEEKRQRALQRPEEGKNGAGQLDDVPAGLPALARAVKLQEKASSVGFDWHDPKLVLAKLQEEAGELAAEIDRSPNEPERIEDEIGDLLFTVANLARHLGADPDQALRRTNAKFISRFEKIEEFLARAGRTPVDASLDEMEAIWQRAKSSE